MVDLDKYESVDAAPSSPIGALSSYTKKSGDGKWCGKCRETGFYNWLSMIMAATLGGERVVIYERCRKHPY